MKADTAAGLALTALGLAMAAGATEPSVALVAMPAVTLPVIWRRSAPFAAAVVLSAGVAATFGAGRCGVVIPSALLVLYALGARADRRHTLAGLVLVLAAMVFLALTDPIIEPAALSFVVPLCVATTGIGYAVRVRTRLAEDLAARTRELEAQRERTAALAVAVERTRLAAELDATARDRVREMIALADGGRDDAFARIERLGRDSLNDMRALLGVLRSDGRAPQPTLAQLGALLDAARAGGRVVDLDVEGERRALPGGVELTAYRIVEHALEGQDGVPLAVRAALPAGPARAGAPRRPGDRAGRGTRTRRRARASLTLQAPGVVRARLPVVVRCATARHRDDGNGR